MKIESVEMKTNAENQSANVQILERNCIGNQYPIRKNSIQKRSRLNFLTVCFMLASHPGKVNRLNGDQRRKCACAARGFCAEPKKRLWTGRSQATLLAMASHPRRSIKVRSESEQNVRIKFYLWTESLDILVEKLKNEKLAHVCVTYETLSTTSIIPKKWLTIKNVNKFKCLQWRQLSKHELCNLNQWTALEGIQHTTLQYKLMIIF